VQQLEREAHAEARDVRRHVPESAFALPGAEVDMDPRRRRRHEPRQESGREDVIPGVLGRALLDVGDVTLERVRLRSRHVTWSTGSWPFDARIAAAAKLLIEVFPAAASVRLMPSTLPLSIAVMVPRAHRAP